MEKYFEDNHEREREIKPMNGWMNGWEDGGVDRWTDQQMGNEQDRQTDRQQTAGYKVSQKICRHDMNIFVDGKKE